MCTHACNMHVVLINVPTFFSYSKCYDKMPPRRTYNKRRVRVHLTKKRAHVHATCM